MNSIKKWASVPRNKKILIFIIEIELLLVLLLVFWLSTSAHRNGGSGVSGGPEDGTPARTSENADVISAAGGVLSVNNISVKVPQESANYAISYGWAEDDEGYPTIPLVATVSYPDEEGNPLFEISVYRDAYFPKAEIPEGKTAENWYDDWKTSDGSGSGEAGAAEDGSGEEAPDEAENAEGTESEAGLDQDGIRQEPYTVGKVHGFLITSRDTSSVPFSLSDYSGTSSFYFVTEYEDGLAQYIVEGTCHDQERQEEFDKMMQDTFKSLTIGEPGTTNGDNSYDA